MGAVGAGPVADSGLHRKRVGEHLGGNEVIFVSDLDHSAIFESVFDVLGARGMNGNDWGWVLGHQDEGRVGAVASLTWLLRDSRRSQKPNHRFQAYNDYKAPGESCLHCGPPLAATTSTGPNSPEGSSGEAAL